MLIDMSPSPFTDVCTIDSSIFLYIIVTVVLSVTLLILPVPSKNLYPIASYPSWVGAPTLPNHSNILEFLGTVVVATVELFKLSTTVTVTVSDGVTEKIRYLQ